MEIALIKKSSSQAAHLPTAFSSSVTRWWNKKLSNFSLYCQKSRKINFTWKLFYLIYPKKYQNIWATFVTMFVPRRLKNRPIWSHCSQATAELLILLIFNSFDRFLRKCFSFWEIAFESRSIVHIRAWEQCDQIGRFITLWATF